jgi:hypothetical protein
LKKLEALKNFSFCVFGEKIGAMELDLELYSRKGGEVLLCGMLVM